MPAVPVLMGSVMNLRGSVTWPVSADAAAVSGEARKTPASLCPMRPGKLRLVVEIQLSGSLRRPKVSCGPPRHAAQEAAPMLQPASTSVS